MDPSVQEIDAGIADVMRTLPEDQLELWKFLLTHLRNLQDTDPTSYTIVAGLGSMLTATTDILLEDSERDPVALAQDVASRSFTDGTRDAMDLSDMFLPFMARAFISMWGDEAMTRLSQPFSDRVSSENAEKETETPDLADEQNS